MARPAKRDRPAVQSTAVDGAPDLRRRWWFAFRPAVLVFVLTGYVVFHALFHLLASGVWALWADTYRVVDWEMTETDATPGHVWIKGQLVGSGRPVWQQGVQLADGGYALAGAPSVRFEPGRRTPMWWSDAAPDLPLKDLDTNGVAVAVMPVRPGWGQVLGWLVLMVGTAWAGVRLMRWAGRATVAAGDRSLKRPSALQ